MLSHSATDYRNCVPILRRLKLYIDGQRIQYGSIQGKTVQVCVKFSKTEKCFPRSVSPEINHKTPFVKHINYCNYTDITLDTIATYMIVAKQHNEVVRKDLNLPLVKNFQTSCIHKSTVYLYCICTLDNHKLYQNLTNFAFPVSSLSTLVSKPQGTHDLVCLICSRVNLD